MNSVTSLSPFITAVSGVGPMNGASHTSGRPPSVAEAGAAAPVIMTSSGILIVTGRCVGSAIRNMMMVRVIWG